MFHPRRGASFIPYASLFNLAAKKTEDDLLLVAIDTQHHDSHHKTVFEERLSRDQCEKMFQLLLAATQLIRNPGLLEARESVCCCSFCLSSEPFSTHQALVVSSYFLSWCFFSRTRSHHGYCSCCSSAGSHTSFQHISRWTVNSFFGTSTLMLPKSSVNSLRYDDLWPHGIVVKL